MRGWKQGDMILAGQESRYCFDFISDVGIYFSLPHVLSLFCSLFSYVNITHAASFPLIHLSSQY